MPDIPALPLLAHSARGQDVIHLQAALAFAGCFDGDIDGVFGAATDKALSAFQAKKSLTVTGTLSQTEAVLLGWKKSVPEPTRIGGVSGDLVAQIFDAMARPNMDVNLPAVLNALAAADLSDRSMIAMALATIRVETSRFLPISEQSSRFNTSPGGKPFDLYDNRQELGNQGAPDGARFCGRGFIQLTGRANYDRFGIELGLGMGLVTNPFLAHDSFTAARLLAAFLKSREARIRKALAAKNYSEARRLVNGGSNGLDEFTSAIRLALNLLPAQVKIAA